MKKSHCDEIDKEIGEIALLKKIQMIYLKFADSTANQQINQQKRPEQLRGNGER